MKIYKIKVNGKTYRVELESLEEVASAAPAAAAAASKPAPEKKSDAPAPAASSDGTPVTSPIQGGVVKVLVKVGDKVKKGDPIAVIEAMKLENEVVSSAEGEVVAVLVEKGNSVASGDPLIRVR